MSSSSLTPTTKVLLFTGGLISLCTFFAFRKKSSNKVKTIKSSKELMTVEEFKKHYEWLSRDLVEISKKEFELPEVSGKRILDLLDYSVPGGKVNRGLTIVNVAEVMISDRQLTNEEKRMLAALGWTIEWMQASFLVADDMMDSSLTRRGNPCWYRVDGVGNAAINDALILLTQMEIILDRYVQDHPQYSKMRQVLVETTYETELGQLLDLTTQPPGAIEVDLSLYTIKRYKQIVKYKTAFYSFVAPVVLGLLFAGIVDKKIHSNVRQVCLLMGEYFQIQDDVLDVYGDPKIIGKIGTDIEDAKCSWVVVQALERANVEQKKILKAEYGKKSHESVAKVKELFKAMKLEELFEEYEENVVKEIKSLIATIGDPLIEHVCENLLKRIYKREK